MNEKTGKIISVTLFVPLIFFVIIWLMVLINPEKSPIFMGSNVIYVGYFITLLGTPIAYLFTKGKSGKIRYKIWGTAILLFSGPFMYSLGFSLALYERDGFVAVGAWMVFFPILLLIGLSLVLIGIFKKDNAKQP